jgi:hypothetical protein
MRSEERYTFQNENFAGNIKASAYGKEKRAWEKRLHRVMVGELKK